MTHWGVNGLMHNEPNDDGWVDPRMDEFMEDSPKTGPSPTGWAWPQLIEHPKVATQPAAVG